MPRSTLSGPMPPLQRHCPRCPLGSSDCCPRLAPPHHADRGSTWTMVFHGKNPLARSSLQRPLRWGAGTTPAAGRPLRAPTLASLASWRFHSWPAPRTTTSAGPIATDLQPQPHAKLVPTEQIRISTQQLPIQPWTTPRPELHFSRTLKRSGPRGASNTSEAGTGGCYAQHSRTCAHG